MRLSELAVYARNKYHIQEQHKWTSFPGFSVLQDPQTGKWVALLMRGWDERSGEEIERCDLKCGIQSLSACPLPYLSRAFRMKGPKWIGVTFSSATDKDVIFQLFDLAVTSGEQLGYTMVLPPVPGPREVHETPLPFAGTGTFQPTDILPERIREMKHLYNYEDTSARGRADNFVRQGLYMQDFEDEKPWPGTLDCPFPTYCSMTTRELRGYFTWRAHLRKGEFGPISPSGAYIYVYELLNGIGAISPEDALEKMRTFEKGYLDQGMGKPQLRMALHRWMLDLAVVSSLPVLSAQKYANPDDIRRDNCLAILKAPGEHTDEEVFRALCFMGSKDLERSPAVSTTEGKGIRLFSRIWRDMLSSFRLEEKDLFALSFGAPRTEPWSPFAGAVYLWKDQCKISYDLDPCRRYTFENWKGTVTAYNPLFFNKKWIQSLLRQADLMIRRHLKTGHYLKEKEEGAWAAGCIRKAIAGFEHDKRCPISIDLSGLEKIRRDAGLTRDALLTEEEMDLPEKQDSPLLPQPPLPQPSPPPGSASSLPLDSLQLQVLRALLNGQDPDGTIRLHHLMPSMVADAINEILMDAIGDTVIDCDGKTLSLAEDYRDEIVSLLGGTNP